MLIIICLFWLSYPFRSTLKGQTKTDHTDTFVYVATKHSYLLQLRLSRCHQRVRQGLFLHDLANLTFSLTLERVPNCWKHAGAFLQPCH